MWKCPKCGKECDGDKCLECGIENLDGKVGNIVGGDNNGEYFMVSADFFKKKKVNIFGLIGFILAVMCALFGYIAVELFGTAVFYILILGHILSIALSIIGIKRFNAKTQTGYKLAVGGTYIAVLSLGFYIGFNAGNWLLP